jgi:hypothetical protein
MVLFLVSTFLTLVKKLTKDTALRLMANYVSKVTVGMLQVRRLVELAFIRMSAEVYLVISAMQLKQLRKKDLLIVIRVLLVTQDL